MDSNPSDVSFVRVQVVDLFLQSLAFGIYLITCGFCYRVFFTTRTHQRCSWGLDKNWPMFLIFLIFLAKTTSSIVLHFYLTLQVVTVGSLDKAVALFTNGSNPVILSKFTTIVVQTVIGSGVLIYRCWVVYNRLFLAVVIPFILWLGAIALMGVVIHFDTVLKINGLFSTWQSRIYGNSFWAVITAVNILTSWLIAYRVWRINQLRNRQALQSESHSTTPTTTKRPCFVTDQPQGKIKQATNIIIDSGLIYTIMSIITLFLFVEQHDGIYAAIDVLVQVIGISFNLIMIRSRPRVDCSYEATMNNVPLQFVSSNSMTASGSAIEFAFPKYYNPRRKSSLRPPSVVIQQEEIGPTLSAPPTATHTHSQHSISLS